MDRPAARIGTVDHLPRKGVKLPVPEGASGGLHQSKPGVTALPRIVCVGPRLVRSEHNRHSAFIFLMSLRAISQAR
jgi:hypothetical protein